MEYCEEYGQEVDHDPNGIQHIVPVGTLNHKSNHGILMMMLMPTILMIMIMMMMMKMTLKPVQVDKRVRP